MLELLLLSGQLVCECMRCKDNKMMCIENTLGGSLPKGMSETNWQTGPTHMHGAGLGSVAAAEQGV